MAPLTETSFMILMSISNVQKNNGNRKSTCLAAAKIEHRLAALADSQLNTIGTDRHRHGSRTSGNVWEPLHLCDPLYMGVSENVVYP